MLGAIGCKDEKFCERVYFFPSVKKRGAQAVPQRRSARFSSRKDLHSTLLQSVVDEAKLGRLTASVDTLKGDKRARQNVVILRVMGSTNPGEGSIAAMISGACDNLGRRC